jgi:uncharacterized membrane protein
MGHSHLAALPTAIYGFILMMAGTAYYILKTTIVRSQGAASPLQAALGSDAKGKLSVVGYLIAVPIAFVNSWLAAAIYVGIATIWLIPDRRIERHLQQHV